MEPAGIGSPHAATARVLPLPAVLGIAAAAGAVTFLLSRSQPFGLSDEALEYFVGRAFARGEDIFRFGHLGPYLPGQYAWYGSLFALLGDGVWVLRLGRALLVAAMAAPLARVLSRYASRVAALAAALTIAVVIYASATTFASGLVVAVALGVLAGPAPPSRRGVLGAALLAGFLCGVREDSAVLALGVACAACWRRRSWRDLATAVAPGLAAGFAPWLLLFALRGELPGLVAQVGNRFALMATRVAYPHRAEWGFSRAALLASPRSFAISLLPLAAAVPVLTYAGMLAAQARRRLRQRPLHLPAVVAGLAGIAYLPQFFLDRRDLWHLRAHLHVFVAVAAVGIGMLSLRRQRAAAGLMGCAALVGAAGIVAQHRLARATPYPCCEGRRIGAALEGGVPPWAGFGQGGGTLIVLGYGPGWYAVEGITPGTRFLMPFDLYLRRPQDRAELIADLAAPANRWVIFDGTLAQPAEVTAALERGYARTQAFRDWRLFARRATGP